MALYALRARLPLLAFLLLAVLCLMLVGFACACLSGDPMQAIERALAAGPTLPAPLEMWPVSLLAALLLARLTVSPSAACRPSAPSLQRFLL